MWNSSSRVTDLSTLPSLNQLDDDALLDLYGRGKLSLLYHQLFNRPRPSPHVFEFLRQLSKEISVRGLDQNHGPTASSS